MIVHESWREIVDGAYGALSADYRLFLEADKDYFPNFDNFLNAFKTLPKSKTKAVLFGQDPYPRKASAIGYAFIDGAVENIFGTKGLSREVNRATSLRNFIKMVLLSSLNKASISQEEIANIDKSSFIGSMMELRDNFETNGVLLLNTALVFTTKEESLFHIKSFEPFMKRFLLSVAFDNLDLILFGNIAKGIKKLLPINHNFNLIETCHPYNLEFITDKSVCKYFSKMQLLNRKNC